jgi:hypothetical protein
MNGAPESPILHILLGFVAPVPIRRNANLTKISCGLEQIQSQTPPPMPALKRGGLIIQIRNTFGELHYDVLPVQRGELRETECARGKTSCTKTRLIEMMMRYPFRSREKRQTEHPGNRPASPPLSAMPHHRKPE